MSRIHNLARVAGSFTAAAVACVVGGGLAAADTTDPGLPPDMAAYCVKNTPFATQQQVNGWRVTYNGILGAPGQNNWACDYRVLTTLPSSARDGSNFSIPYPVPYHQGIDFNYLCSTEYPGAGTDWSTTNNDWTCIAPAGRTYGAELYDGTHEYSDG